MDTLLRSRWPMVAMVNSYFPSLRGLAKPYAIGSATLINSNALLTAGHVVYDPCRGGYADKFEISLGDGSPTIEVPGEANGRVHPWWKQEKKLDPLSAVDAGVILLDKPASPRFALQLQTTLNDFGSLPINVLGFPADPLVPAWQGWLAGARTQALNLGEPLNGFRIAYPVYTYDGMSGGPVLRVDEIGNGTFSMRGIHTSLVDSMGNGLMLYEDLLDRINDWSTGGP
jgi:V8-like Glu-specific endopeptidase